MAKSRLTRSEEKELQIARETVSQLRELADNNARRLVAQARETIARLTAKRDNRIWL